MLPKKWWCTDAQEHGGWFSVTVKHDLRDLSLHFSHIALKEDALQSDKIGHISANRGYVSKDTTLLCFIGYVPYYIAAKCVMCDPTFISWGWGDGAKVPCDRLAGPWTFVSVNPPDIFKKTSGPFPVTFVCKRNPFIFAKKSPAECVVTKRGISSLRWIKFKKQSCVALMCRCILLVWRFEPVTSDPSAAVALKSCVCTSWLGPAVRSLSQLMVFNVMITTNFTAQRLNWPDSISVVGVRLRDLWLDDKMRMGEDVVGCACTVDPGNPADP